MSKNQWLTIAVFALITLCIYCFFDLKPQSFDNVEQDRKLSFVKTDINLLIRDARKELNDIDKVGVDILNKEVNSNPDSTNTSKLEELAGKWFQLGHPEISGYYAAEIAKIKETSDAWGIAGTTFAIGLKRSKNVDVRDYSQKQAIDAFDRAISMDPENVDHKLNKALVYTDMPPADNPMKGIQQLLGLNKSNPEHIGVLNQLGRLAIQTNQFEKAVQRLEKVLSLQPENKNALCMLSSAYEGLNKLDQARVYRERCVNADK